jgi:hypothetical protein
MKILIKESQYKVLLEQSNSNIQKAYNEIVAGAKYWMGTDKTKILKSFDYIKNKRDFETLKSMFKDRRTGYGSFEEMIKKEYDVLDVNDIEKLKTKLNSIGVNFNYVSNYHSMLTNNFLIGEPYLAPKECSSKWQSQLEKAKNYWIQWLSNPITKNKFLNNWKKVEKNMTSAKVENIFKKYIDSLKVLKLYYYDNKSESDPLLKDSYAYVNESNPDKIFVNCSKNDRDPYGTLIHEIQHMLYDIKPLNPEVQIANVFVNSNTKKSTIETFFDFKKNPKQKTFSYDKKLFNPNEIAKLNSTSTQIGVPFESLQYILNNSKYHEKRKPGYACSETEKMSNIMSVRNLFGVKPGQNITKEMLLPYIKEEKNNDDVSWVLACWALRGFPDLSEMLNKINDLAYQNANQNNNSSTRTV